MRGPEEPSTPGLRFDTYPDNAALAALLGRLAAAYPGLVELRVLGRSHEGTEIWLLVLTNVATGPDTTKPGFWIDGNLHAKELAGTSAALYAAHRLLSTYGTDLRATAILDRQAVYVVPRLSPDGAALVLGQPPALLRSGSRPYPYPERQPGLHSRDVDGDGRLLQMRIADPAGDWKACEPGGKWMLRRRPDEEGGDYYRVFPEGEIEGYDGHLVTVVDSLLGTDFNRNFPAGWRPEGEQAGAGEHPGSEPEVLAVIEFFARHPNVYGAVSFHTYSRVILRPLSDRPDSDMDLGDRRVYDAIGERGAELTGYAFGSTYHNFRYHPERVITGTFDDWLYKHKGVYAFTVELWDLPTAAGILEKNREKRFFEWFDSHPVEDDWKIFNFVEATMSEGFVEWYPFDHPQLGRVELGGWDQMFTWRNPPPALLEAEIAPQSDFVLSFLALAPQLAWRTIEATPLGGNLFRVRAVVENTGFLSTCGSRQARAAKAARTVRVGLELPPGATLESGAAWQDLGHLEGRSNKLSLDYFDPSPTDHRGKAEWTVRTLAGSALTLRAKSDRAGCLSATVLCEIAQP